MKHFFWHMAIQCLEESMPFLNSCNSVLPGSHSSHFFLSATSKGFSPYIQKAGLALHYPLQFAPKSSFSYSEGDAVWSEELYSAESHSWVRTPLGVIILWAKGPQRVGGRGSPNHHSFFMLHLQITMSPTCSAFLWDCRWECRRRMRGTPFRACRFKSQ